MKLYNQEVKVGDEVMISHSRLGSIHGKLTKRDKYGIAVEQYRTGDFFTDLALEHTVDVPFSGIYTFTVFSDTEYSDNKEEL